MKGDWYVVPGFLRQDGSWWMGEPWLDDGRWAVNVIRRTLSNAIGRIGGAVAYAECLCSAELWDNEREIAEPMLERALHESFEQLIEESA